MDDMLFQYDDGCASLGSRGIIVGMLLAQNIMPGEVCCVTAKNDAIVGFTRPDTERLEESVLHGDIIPHFLPNPAVLFPVTAPVQADIRGGLGGIEGLVPYHLASF